MGQVKAMACESGHHVYAVASGFGLRVIPYAPYKMRHGSCGENVLEVQHGAKYAQVHPNKTGGHTSKIAEGTASLAEVVNVELGHESPTWIIEAEFYSCPFPKGYWLCSTDGQISQFELLGESDELIFFQSPKRMPPVAQLVANGQEVVRLQDDPETGWIELSYDHDGIAHRQRHQVLTRTPHNLALTVQAPSDVFDGAREAMLSMANGLRFREASDRPWR
jgi:hypothetical protein